jgi:hypothetical protein
MSNLAEELANRGSKLCMQISVNNTDDDVDPRTGRVVRKSRKHLLDDKIGLGSIKWLSPLTSESYKEYKLEEISQKYPELNLERLDWKRLGIIKSQWDAIGVSPDGTLIIVEAKAHTRELEKTRCGASEKNKQKISALVSQVMGDNPVWMDGFYQTANRYVYLDALLKAGIKARLVYLYFINDVSYRPESEEAWNQFFKTKFNLPPVPTNLEGFVSHIYIDLWKDKGI